MQYQPPRSYTSTRRRENSFSRNQNTVAFASPIKLGPVAHTILVALMVTVLGLIYLTQATQATNYDYVKPGSGSELDIRVGRVTLGGMTIEEILSTSATNLTLVDED